MDCFVARAPRNDVEDPLRLAGIRGPHSLPVIASASEAIHAAAERKNGLLRRCALRNDVEGPLRIPGMRGATLPPRHCERKRSNPRCHGKKAWIASSQELPAMTWKTLYDSLA